MNLTGTYRKIVSKPEDLAWEFLDPETPGTGLKIKFILQSSSYATICLREIIGEEPE
jgi:tRNA(Glu) U13 pseudouridine synthase TruD